MECNMWKQEPPHKVKSTITCTILKNESFKEDFILTLKPEKKINFKAGQFALIHNKDFKRPFSIASPPSDENITFLVRAHPEGTVTPYLHNLKKGSKIEISAPYGAFIIKEEFIKNTNELIFISSGTGIAPFHSIIPDTLKRFPNKKITLVHGYRFECFFENDWKELAKTNKNFNFYPVCSRPESNFKGLKGRITEHLKDIVKYSKDKMIFLCGAEQMIDDTKKILFIDCNFKEEQIIVEKWRENYIDCNKKEIKNSKKLKIGWFSYSCCEDSTIVFTELLNDHYNEWSKLIEFQHIRILKSKNKLEGLDVAFVEGSIASKHEEDKVKEIRRNCKKLIAVGSCAVNGAPSAQRNEFNQAKIKEINFLMKKFHLAKKVKKLEDVVKVDAKVPGCPMNEETFLKVLNDTLKEFKII